MVLAATRIPSTDLPTRSIPFLPLPLVPADAEHLNLGLSALECTQCPLNNRCSGTVC